MGTGYALLIQEDVAQLHAAEKAARDKSRTDRVRLLRFLKEERARSIVQAAAALGYSVRTAERWWRCYCEGGLSALMAPPGRRGMAERITPEAWEGLQAEMRAGRIGGLHEAQAYLRDTWHIGYGIDALSKLFQRHKTKLKTGRLRHRKAASPAEPAAFKKGAGRHGVAACAAAGLRHGRAWGGGAPGPVRPQSHASPVVVPVRPPPALGS
jgi:transposase